jgi:hypothetical protein
MSKGEFESTCLQRALNRGGYGGHKEDLRTRHSTGEGETTATK